jgi:hypothetical protein
MGYRWRTAKEGKAEGRKQSMGSTLRHRIRWFATAVGIGVAGLVMTAPAANAGVLVASAASCDAQNFEQPFLPWADVASYVLAPAGTFECANASWSLSGGAAVTDGNETYSVHGAGEAQSLSLPAGSSATSGAMCVGIEHPTLRIFTRNTGSPTSKLNVEVLFEDATGAVRSLPIGTLTGSASWQPSVLMPVVANLLPLLPGERTAVEFRFSAGSDGGAWQIDDVYVDPYRSY